MQLILAVLGAFATLASAQTPTVNVFMPTPYQSTVSFVASVLGVCHGSTTYGIRCTEGVLASGTTCAPDTPEFTVTEASDVYEVTTTMPISSADLTMTETCSLKGTRSASCTADITIIGSGKTTIRSTSSTLAGTDVPEYYRYQLPVTGYGTELLKATGNICRASGVATTNAPLAFGAVLGAFVFTAAVLL